MKSQPTNDRQYQLPSDPDKIKLITWYLDKFNRTYQIEKDIISIRFIEPFEAEAFARVFALHEIVQGKKK